MNSRICGTRRQQPCRRRHPSLPFLFFVCLVLFDCFPSRTHIRPQYSLSSSSSLSSTVRKQSIGIGVLGDLVLISTVVKVTETVTPGVTTAQTADTTTISTEVGASHPLATTFSGIIKPQTTANPTSGGNTLASSPTSSDTDTDTATSTDSSPKKKLPVYAIGLAAFFAIIAGLAALGAGLFYLFSRRRRRQLPAAIDQLRQSTTGPRWKNIQDHIMIQKLRKSISKLDIEKTDRKKGKEKDNLTSLSPPDNIDEINSRWGTGMGMAPSPSSQRNITSTLPPLSEKQSSSSPYYNTHPDIAPEIKKPRKIRGAKDDLTSFETPDNMREIEEQWGNKSKSKRNDADANANTSANARRPPTRPLIPPPPVPPPSIPLPPIPAPPIPPRSIHRVQEQRQQRSASSSSSSLPQRRTGEPAGVGSMATLPIRSHLQSPSSQTLVVPERSRAREAMVKGGTHPSQKRYYQKYNQQQASSQKLKSTDEYSLSEYSRATDDT